MVRSYMEVHYFEIENCDYTGIMVWVYNNQGQHVATFKNDALIASDEQNEETKRNMEAKGQEVEGDDLQGIWSNQIDKFEIGMLDAFLLYDSNKSYTCTKKLPIIDNSLKAREQ